MKLKSPLTSLFLLAVVALASAQEKPFHLRSGDRVVFYGNSITDQRLYTTFTETYVLTRFPALDVTFIHSGWGGDRVTGGGGGPIDRRLQRDVLAYQPTVMTMMLGMNDGSYRAFDPGIFDTYRKGYKHIIESVQQAVPGIRLTLIRPSPYDDVTQPPKFDGGYNQVLVRYGEFIEELGQANHLIVADLNAPVVAALQKANASEAELAKKIIPDRVHPGPAGHLLMAAELLKAWNAPSLVTAVEIDAATKQVTAQRATQVSALQVGDTVGWTQLDAALPMPVMMRDPVIELAVNSSDLMAALNQQPLKVTGLTGSRYELRIDGLSVGEFTPAQLAGGINLAARPTPMVNQAMEVHQLTLQHNNIHFFRWRQIEVPLATYNSDNVQRAGKELLAALDQEEAAVVKQQRAKAQPVERKYELLPR